MTRFLKPTVPPVIRPKLQPDAQGTFWVAIGPSVESWATFGTLNEARAFRDLPQTLTNFGRAQIRQGPGIPGTLVER